MATEAPDLAALVRDRAEDIRAAAARHNGRAVSLFGSVARGEHGPNSDLDFLVSFEPGSSLYDLIDLEDELVALLGVPVDVVSVGGLLDRDEHIRRDAVPV